MNEGIGRPRKNHGLGGPRCSKRVRIFRLLENNSGNGWPGDCGHVSGAEGWHGLIQNNDFRPVALTSYVMKSFEKYMVSILKTEVNSLLDPL